MQKRNEFLRLCITKKLSMATTLSYTDQMRGKTDEEKERLAEKFIAELKDRK